MNIKKLLNQYPLSLAGFEGKNILIETAGFWSGAKILIDGESAPRGLKRGSFILKNSEGKEINLQVKFNNILNPIPKILVNDRYVYLTEDIKWQQWVWCGLPLILTLLNFILGFLLGSCAFLINSQILGLKLKKSGKNLLTTSISLFFIIFFFIFAELLNLDIRGFHFITPYEFTSKTGSYSIMAPKSLREFNQTFETNPGKIEVHYFFAEKDEIMYLIGYLEYFPIYYQPSDLLMRLDTGPERILNLLDTELISENIISLNGNPGREQIYINQDESGETKIIRFRAFVVNNRMYQMITSYKYSEENSKKADDFFRSFHLLDQ